MISTLQELYTKLNTSQEKHGFFPIGISFNKCWISTKYATFIISQQIYNYILIEFCSNGQAFHYDDLKYLIIYQRNTKLSKI